jgi:hypothetical protein
LPSNSWSGKPMGRSQSHLAPPAAASRPPPRPSRETPPPHTRRGTGKTGRSHRCATAHTRPCLGNYRDVEISRPADVLGSLKTLEANMSAIDAVAVLERDGRAVPRSRPNAPPTTATHVARPSSRYRWSSGRSPRRRGVSRSGLATGCCVRARRLFVRPLGSWWRKGSTRRRC